MNCVHFLQGCRTGSLAWLCAVFLLSIECLQAQPILVAENKQPQRYTSAAGAEYAFSFSLPGKRYAQVGSFDNGSLAIQQSGIMLAVTKQNGDTVRYVQVRAHPPGVAFVYPFGAVAEPDHSVTVFAGCYSPLFSPNSDSLLLLRIDTLGVVRWRRGYRLAYCRPSNSIGNILRTGDSYLLCTNRDAFAGTSALFYPTPNVTKIDFQGNIVWERSMGTRGYARIGEVRDLVSCPDGSYLAFGNTDEGTPYVPGTSARGRLDYFAVRFNSAGDTLRTFRFGDHNEDEVGQRIRLTPDGGATVIGYRYRYVPFSPPVYDGQVYKLDSLFRPQWRKSQTYTTPAPYATPTSWRYSLLQPLASGDVLCGGDSLFDRNYAVGNAAALTCYAPGGGRRWAFRRVYRNGPSTSFATMVNHPDGSAYFTGTVGVMDPNSTTNLIYSAYSAYLANAGVPYVPDLCARPPAAYFVAQAASPAQAQVLDASAPGPRYGVLVAWRWDWGDGTASTGRAPGPHAYASPPPPGTAVTLTVTNNLGCTASRTEYPFGPLSAARQARALAGRLAVFPNPAAGAVAVALDGLAPQAPAALALLGPLGQVLRRASAPVQNGRLAAALDLNGLPPGLYLLRVSTQEGTATRPLVKE